jgi:hypothetical protein
MSYNDAKLVEIGGNVLTAKQCQREIYIRWSNIISDQYRQCKHANAHYVLTQTYACHKCICWF